MNSRGVRRTTVTAAITGTSARSVVMGGGVSGGGKVIGANNAQSAYSSAALCHSALSGLGATEG